MLAKPIEIERVVPLALEPCRQLCDTMLFGLSGVLARVRIDSAPTPWEDGEDGATVSTLSAGKALKARLELSPAETGTRIRLRVSGVVLMLGRKEILQGIMEKLEEMGDRL